MRNKSQTGGEMKYFSKNVGDFSSATRHLNLTERGAYNDLVDYYYATEKALPSDLETLCRIAGALSELEREAVRKVASEFFEVADGRLFQEKIEEQIAAYRKQVEKNRINGKSGGRPPKKKPNENPVGFPSDTQEEPKPKAIQYPVTSNHVNNPPNPPSPSGDEGDASPSAKKPKRERKTRVSLKTFIERCAQAGEKAISEYKPLIDYVEATGLPMEFVQLCWESFKEEHLGEGEKASRMQANWRQHLLNYVKKGYYKLWYAKPDGSYELTTQGIQAKTYHAKKAA
ncbi:MAG: YdaU family protein [Pseudomonadota bacterium]